MESTGVTETTGSPEATEGLEATTGAGDQYEGEPTDVLTAGAERTGGILTDKRMVAYYGHPFSAAMGELGQYGSPEEMVAALKEQAAAYTEADPSRPAVPTIELIASVAQPAPGPDGDYLQRTPTEVIERYAEVAKENDTQLMLDVQIGRSTVAEEVEAIRPFLERPYVHLAIDTEYDMAPGEVPAQQVGSTPAWEIQEAASTLSRIVEENDLPPKVMLVHQFEYGMILNKQALRPTDNVQTVIHADGFGYQKTKFSKYEALVENEPVQYGGFKVFYDRDINLLSPEEVLSLNPPPAVVTYQ